MILNNLICMWSEHWEKLSVLDDKLLYQVDNGDMLW
jgi:hypothetical protein